MKRQDKSITLLENIIRKSMDEVMHESMMPYAEHVILERALPRAEDGLKPVQRRILYTMMELQLSADKPHRKSARIVGDCLGKYHPHGDSSVYDAMVRMAQPFNMELPLVDGHGNFGSVDGDSAAAMRYTEARMTTAAMQLLADIEKDTVSFSWNFDDTLKEPVLLPARFPNLLINGASGIAVGLATNMPPHNPREAIDAVIAQLDKPEITVRELMRILPGPDFPTGGFLMDTAEIERAYETGRGKLVMRAKTHFEEMKNGKTRIVITELPYQVNKAAALEKILQLSQEKKAMFASIADIRDESDRQGMRAVIEIKKDGEPERVLQNLYKYSDLQCTFGANLVAIAEGKPQQLGLKQLLAYYISHRREVVTRRTRFELETAKRREHILAGLMIAVDNVDEVIRLIRSSKTPKQAKEKLMDAFSLSEIQAQAILDLRLQRLTNLELDTIRREYAEIVKLIAKLESILASPKKLDALIKSELSAQRELFPQERRTQFIKESDIETLPEPEPLPAEEMTVTLIEGFKLRKQPKRTASANAEEKTLFTLCAPDDSVLRLFMDNGSMVSVKLSELAETKPAGKPVNLASVVELEKDESVVLMTADLGTDEFLFVTDDGMIKRSKASEYAVKIKRTQAVGLKEGAKLIAILPVKAEENCELMLVSHLGMSIRFGVDSIPVMGRTAAGVKCMKLGDRDRVFFVDKATDEGELLVLSDKGFGKRSFMFDYAVQGRNGTGVKTFDFKKNGSNGTRLVSAAIVRQPITLKLKQRHGTETEVTSEHFRIEPKASRGSLVVTCVLDDDVVEVTQ